MTGRRIIAVACSVALVATASYAADGTRSRTDVAVASQPATAATGEPASYTAYMNLVGDGGSLAANPYIPSAAELNRGTTARIIRDPKSGGDDCAREPFPCGIYVDKALFQAEQGPFSEALGNLEDFEATNPPAGSICTVANPPADCQFNPGSFGFCNAGAIDPGDIQQGLEFINDPFRNRDDELLISGIGFNGGASKYVLPNYFADAHIVTFPNLATKTGPCDNPATAPSVWGADMVVPAGQGGPGAIMTVVLENGDSMEITTGPIPSSPASAFIGVCCESPIKSIKLIDSRPPPAGRSVGLDNVMFGPKKLDCPPAGFPPLTLEDINCALELIEAKLDAGVGGSGGGCGFCEDEIDAVADGGARSRLRHRRNQACKAEVNGHYEQAAHHRCQMQAEIDAQEASGAITPAEAAALRQCTADEQADRSDDPC